jgi:uncharacterized membrane protein
LIATRGLIVAIVPPIAVCCFAVATDGDPNQPGLPVTRIETLTDGVFAIAMTVLVLDLALPQGTGSLGERLWVLWPKLASYVLSFVMLGVLWIGHHYQLNHLRRTNRILIWLNLGFLLAITFLPFGAGVLGSEYRDPWAVVLYAGTVMLGGLSLLAHWAYATRHPELLAPDVDANVARTLKLRIWVGEAILAGAVAVGFIDTRISLAVFLALPMIYLVKSRIDLAIRPRT